MPDFTVTIVRTITYTWKTKACNAKAAEAQACDKLDDFDVEQFFGTLEEVDEDISIEEVEANDV